MTMLNESPMPNPDLKPFELLIGKWQVSGGAEGNVTYRWMAGGFFLLQDIDLMQFGQPVVGLEVIGHLQPFGEAPSPDIKSRYYDSLGNTLDYTYEFDGETLTIWGGEKGSPAHYKGQLSADGNTLNGEWVYPDGGGYSSVMRRMK